MIASYGFTYRRQDPAYRSVRKILSALTERPFLRQFAGSMLTFLVILHFANAAPQSIEVGRYSITPMPMVLEYTGESITVLKGCLYKSRNHAQTTEFIKPDANSESLSRFALPLHQLPGAFVDWIESLSRDDETKRVMTKRELASVLKNNRSALQFFNVVNQDLGLVTQRFFDLFFKEWERLADVEAESGISPETGFVQLSFEEQELTKLGEFGGDVLEIVSDFSKTYDQEILSKNLSAQTPECPPTIRSAFLGFVNELNAFSYDRSGN